MTPALTIRFPGHLNRSDRAALRRLESEFHEVPVSVTTDRESGRPAARRLSGEVYNLDTVPQFRARRLAHQRPDRPLPPAGGSALLAA